MSAVRRPRRACGGAARSAAGFTLIELLVALTLFALLSVALVGGLGFGARVWESGHERSAAFAEVFAVHDFLRDRFVGARASASPGPATDVGPAFLGSPEGTRFIAPLPEYVGLGGLYRFELAATGEADRSDLVVTWHLFREDRAERDGEDSEEISRRVLIEGIEELEIRYYGTLAPDEAPDWHDAWDDTGRLPLLIDLNLRFPPGDPRAWPRLVVALVAAQP